MDVIDEDEDAAREDEQHGDDAESADGIEPDKEVYGERLFASGSWNESGEYSHARGGSMVCVVVDGILQSITQNKPVKVKTENVDLKSF